MFIMPTYCQIFWGFMSTIFFILGWASFYNTKVCIDNVRVVIEGDKSVIVGLSAYVALGVVVYCLLLLSFPLIYLIQVLRKIVNDAKLVLGVEVANAGCNFLTATIFPILCIFMEDFCGDEASLWASIGIMGCLFCVLVCHANPADYRLADAFPALWLGVCVNLNDTIGKSVVLAIIYLSIFVSGEIQAHKRSKEARFSCTT